MAKREVYVCDEVSCGRVLVNPGDGFVFHGSVYNTETGGGATPVEIIKVATHGEQAAGTTPEQYTKVPTVLCIECALSHLGLGQQE